MLAECVITLAHPAPAPAAVEEEALPGSNLTVKEYTRFVRESATTLVHQGASTKKLLLAARAAGRASAAYRRHRQPPPRPPRLPR